MKKTMIAGGLAAISLAALLAGAATAQNATTTQQPVRQARADVDGDGRVSQAEFIQARTTRMAALDLDRDGSLTRQEMRGDRGAERFDRLDADKDGVLTRTEFDARRAQRAAAPARAADIFARLDADKDGSVSRGEFDMRRAQRADGPRQRGPGARQGQTPLPLAELQVRAATAFARLDADKDGFVTVEERRTARTAMRETRQERRAERMARRAARGMPASPPAPASE